MSNLAKILLFTGSFIGGFYLGKGTVKDDIASAKYEVVMQDNKHYLRSNELNKALPIYDVNNETYVGDIDHMVTGIKNMYDEMKLENLVEKR